MHRRAIAKVGAALMATALLAACGGTSSTYDTPVQIANALNVAGIECKDFEATGGAFTFVSCTDTATPLNVYYYPDGESMRGQVCSSGDATDFEVEVAIGGNWFAEGTYWTPTSQIAEALGGEATTYGDYCS